MAVEPIRFRRDDVDGRPPRPVSGDLDRLLSNFGAPPASILTVLQERWLEIVGPVAFEHCRPGALVDGRLRVEVQNSTWASQLRWQEADMVQRAAALVGADSIRTMDVRVSHRW